MHGTLGIGCISDYEAQPILVRSHHGTFAVTTVGKINNSDELVEKIIKNNAHFFEMQGGDINQTELVAAIIDQKIILSTASAMHRRLSTAQSASLR